MSSAKPVPARAHTDRAAWVMPAHRIEEREEEPASLTRREAEGLTGSVARRSSELNA